jgi:hypothetical protein
MRLTSQQTSNIFWRVFGPKDTVYAIGRWEGILSTGESASFDLPEGELQLELKHRDVFGHFLIKPGRIWKNEDDVVYDGAGLEKPRLTFIAIGSSRVGEFHRLRATGYNNNNTNQEIEHELRWTAVPAGIVTIDATGGVTSLKVGRADIRGEAADGTLSTIVAWSVVA